MLVGAWITCAQPADAQDVEADAETRTAARELAQQGADAFERQDYITALDRFDRADSLIRAPTIGIMQARTLAKLGRWVEALDKYEETQRMPIDPDSPEALHQATADARTEGSELRSRIPLLTIHVVSDHHAMPGVLVLLDGKPVPAALLEVPRPANPGKHDVVGQVQGVTKVTRRVVLSEGDQAEVELSLGSTPAPVVVGPPAAPPPSGPLVTAAPAPRDALPHASDSSRTWGWAAVGVGGVGLVVSAVTGTTALKKKSFLEEHCETDGSCRPEYADELESFRTNRTLSYVSAFVGVASLGVGGSLLLAFGDDGSEVLARVGPSGVSVSGSF